MPEARCPICHADAVRHASLKAAEVAATLSPVAREPARYDRVLRQVLRLWPEARVEIFVCPTCQLGFAWPLVEGDEPFYRVLHERAGYPTDRWEFRQTRERFAPSHGKVLDVGAGRGDFLRTLPPSLERHAVEASDTLRAALTQRGFVAHRDLVEAARNTFALVCLFHVIQYFADPVDALRRCRTMLADGGRVVMSLPNAPAANGRLDDLRSPPHPLTRWSRMAIERALERAGLVVERFEYIPLGPTALLWAANGRTRGRAATAPTSVSAKVDAMQASRLRTALLVALALAHLPAVAMRGHSLLRRSQMFIVARAGRAAPAELGRAGH